MPLQINGRVIHDDEIIFEDLVVPSLMAARNAVRNAMEAELNGRNGLAVLQQERDSLVRLVSIAHGRMRPLRTCFVTGHLAGDPCARCGQRRPGS